MKLLQVVILAVVFEAIALAQDDSVGVRAIVHPTVDLNEHWFVASWGIGNVRTVIPNNVNVFAGIGYRKPVWSLESMVQRQWSKAGNNVMLNFRFNTTKLSERSNLYVEVMPFLTKRIFYDFVVFEYHAIEKFRIGVETENAHKSGHDSLGFGPRVSRPIVTVGKANISAAFAYQLRPREPNVTRIYIVTNIRLGKK